ncbi:MAG: glycoside hydrolase family 2 protein [Oscillospiraceae bacterium]|nr:glycoside hydrolase family 2 protein [Oscillospiraceae bacterium]
MRTVININKDWAFAKDTTSTPTVFPDIWETISLPHTWNAQDGQDGGGDYFRGTCCYAKTFRKADLPESDRYYLEIRGANSSSEVFLNGISLGSHAGGYATWRVDLTEQLREENLLSILVDNSPSQTVYPQVADFTFYGGLYRDVNLICVSSSHFDLDYYGGPGIKVTPVMEGSDAKVSVEVFLTNRKEGQIVRYYLKKADGTVMGTYDGSARACFRIKNARLWNGRKDPYLYTMEAQLLENDTVLDAISTRFGCRSYEIDPERGFILNGKEYPLRGVSRHQDRLGIGNALLPQHHEEDMDLICEVGATTIRLAHYQHDQYFYDLCDERGLVIWAEIPYISNHMPAGRENTISQMKELIVQNYNHPSIVVWGLSNEITMNGAGDKDLLENHRILNDLAHSMDLTRLTTMAVLSMCSMDEDYVHIPDTVSYNHYFGWYGGTTDMNGPWFDKFHAKYPKTPIGCSEYGCEALNWHTSDPRQGDYTEEYQAYYHEELIRQLFTRKYLWATHVWNMFDFGADNRAEGGENGQNHKGLVTFDRKYKKDSFYAYKAWLSDEPFVHICGKRYVDRVEDVTRVTVYSNLPVVELFANGESLGAKEAEDHFFYFSVPNRGETVLTAVAGDCRDESFLRKVDTFNEDYRLKEQGAVLNWFDITEREGYLSLNSTVSQVMATAAGKLWFTGILLGLKKKMDAAGKASGKKDGNPGMTISLKSIGGMMDMMGSFTILRLSSMVGMVGVSFTKEELLSMNAKLNRIKAAK